MTAGPWAGLGDILVHIDDLVQMIAGIFQAAGPVDHPGVVGDFVGDQGDGLVCLVPLAAGV